MKNKTFKINLSNYCNLYYHTNKTFLSCDFVKLVCIFSIAFKYAEDFIDYFD